MGQVSEQLVTANVVVKNWGPEVKKEEAKIDHIKAEVGILSSNYRVRKGNWRSITHQAVAQNPLHVYQWIIRARKGIKKLQTS